MFSIARILAVLVVTFVASIPFSSSASAVAPSLVPVSNVSGTLDNYAVNGAGQVTSFVVKNSNGSTTITIPSPNSELSKRVENAHEKSVTVQYDSDGMYNNFVSMTVQSEPPGGG